SCISGLLSLAPMLDPVRPPIEFLVAVATHVKLFGAVETTINKVGGDILRVRPFSRGVGDDERNVVPSKQREELRDHERGMPDFDAVANRAGRVSLHPGTALHFVVVVLRQLRRRPSVAGK